MRALPLADQMTFLRGRILEESLSMEAVARFLHVRLNGGSNLERAIDTPYQFQDLIKECTSLVAECGRLSKLARPLTLDAIKSAGELYERRNRIVHDALRRDLLSEQQWERFRLSRPRREKGRPLPDPEPASAEDMVALTFALIQTTWRLRGALWCLIGQSKEVSPYLTQPFEPQWDGSFAAVGTAHA